MKPLSLKTERIIRLVVAGLFGLSLGVIIWMFTLPSGFISKRGLAVSIALAILFTFLFYKFSLPYFIQHRNQFNFRWGIIGIVLALLTGIVFQKVITQQSLIFPFMPKQTLTLTLQSDSLSFRPVECELKTLYSKDFIVSGDLQRIDSGLMILRGYGSTLTWTGWPGSTCVFTTDIEPLKVFQLTWGDEGITAIGEVSDNQEKYSWDIVFQTPISTKLIVAALLLLATTAIVLALVCGYMMILNGRPIKQTFTIDNPNTWISNVLTALLIGLSFVLILRVLYQINPLTHFPARDDGVFLYIGQGLLSGQTPYLDAWDHKGPLIYFINALGKLLDPAGEWGIFALIISFNLATIVLLYNLLKKRVGKLALLTGLAVFLGLLLEISGLGNLVEAYVLLFFTVGLTVVISAIETGQTRSLFLFGAMGALAFCLRANLVSLFIIGGIAWFIITMPKRASLFKGIGMMFAGVSIILIPLVAFFASRHALGDLFDQAFRFNFFYASSTGVDLFTKLTDFSSASLPVVVVGLISILFTAGIYWDKPNQNILLSILKATFFLELILSRLSGYDFAHYSLPLLMIAVLILVLLLESLRGPIEYLFVGKGDRYLCGSAILVLLGLGIFLGTGLVRQDFSRQSEEVLQPEILEKLSTRPTLLVWGAEVQVNYLTGRPSPTRFIYQYPLVNNAYCTTVMGDEFLDDIKTNLPVILDASNGNPWMPSLDPVVRESQLYYPHIYGTLNCLQSYFVFLQSNYSPAYTMPGHRWTIYLPNGTDNSQ